VNLKVNISPMNHDSADLDGDGEFDGIDIAILEEEERDISKQTRGQNRDCCVPLIVGVLITIGYTATKIII
jgi:hypothetical protein